MYEISYNDEQLVERYQNDRKIYPNGVYIFTFENRFLVYYFQHGEVYDYVAFDTDNRVGSLIFSSKEILPESEYHSMVNPILNAIKYTGDTRRVTK